MGPIHEIPNRKTRQNPRRSYIRRNRKCHSASYQEKIIFFLISRTTTSSLLLLITGIKAVKTFYHVNGREVKLSERLSRKVAYKDRALKPEELTSHPAGIIVGCRVYKEMLADYMGYRGLEAELVDLKGKYEVLSKTMGDSTKPAV